MELKHFKIFKCLGLFSVKLKFHISCKIKIAGDLNDFKN